jgi:hypothetical protein
LGRFQAVTNETLLRGIDSASLALILEKFLGRVRPAMEARASAEGMMPGSGNHAADMQNAGRRLNLS